MPFISSILWTFETFTGPSKSRRLMLLEDGITATSTELDETCELEDSTELEEMVELDDTSELEDKLSWRTSLDEDCCRESVTTLLEDCCRVSATAILELDCTELDNASELEDS